MTRSTSATSEAVGAVVGVDFGGPSGAAAQRRKIVAIEARRDGPKRYRVTHDGMNERLLHHKERAPGWTAAELKDALVKHPDVAVIAADFPFSIPKPLLDSADFAALVGQPGAFQTRAAFVEFVAANVSLEPPLQLDPLFRPWRRRDLRAQHWVKREMDKAVGAQPALKDRFQCMFNMTLLGVALLQALREAGYAVVPFDAPSVVTRCVIEVYPGWTMRALKRSNYKRDPGAALDTILEHCAAAGVEVEVESRVREVCETYNSAGKGGHDPDVSDALIATCIGIMNAEGLGGAPDGPGDLELRPFEGAIYSLRKHAAS